MSPLLIADFQGASHLALKLLPLTLGICHRQTTSAVAVEPVILGGLAELGGRICLKVQDGTFALRGRSYGRCASIIDVFFDVRLFHTVARR